MTLSPFCLRPPFWGAFGGQHRGCVGVASLGGGNTPTSNTAPWRIPWPGSNHTPPWDASRSASAGAAARAILLVHVTTAEYRAGCSCCATFRTQLEGIEPKAHYDNLVREVVLDRLLEDRLSVLQVQRLAA